MAVKLTKNELKKQKDSLKQFERYLPTLLLKKRQLQLVIRRIEAEAQKVRSEKAALEARLGEWVAVFNENRFFPAKGRLEDLVQVKSVRRTPGNIAGVAIPVFEGLEFKPVEYSFRDYPLWVDKAVDAVKELAVLDAREATLSRQILLLGRELATTSQRVNLFEKVKIPEAKENIRLIGIYLGDQQTSAVVRGKIAKGKLVGGRGL